METLGSKHLYKIFLILIKYISYPLALVQIVALILAYLGTTCSIIPFFAGCSITMLLLLFIISYIFKFCVIHRIPLYYTTSVYFIRFIDIIIGIPLTTLSMFQLHVAVLGIFVILYGIYLYKNRNKPKVDYMKEFCERYCNCC